MKPHRVKRVEPQCRSSRGIQPASRRRTSLDSSGARSSECVPAGEGRKPVARRVHLLRSSRATTGSFAGSVDSLGRVNGGPNVVPFYGPRSPAPTGRETGLGTEDCIWLAPPLLSSRAPLSAPFGCGQARRARGRIGRERTACGLTWCLSVADQVGTPPDPS